MKYQNLLHQTIASYLSFYFMNCYNHSPQKISKHSGIIFLNLNFFKFTLRFLYNRLALYIHCDSLLSSLTLPRHLLSVIKVAQQNVNPQWPCSLRRQSGNQEIIGSNLAFCNLFFIYSLSLSKVKFPLNYKRTII